MNIDEIARRVWKDVCKSSSVGENLAVKYAHALLAELSKDAPVGWIAVQVLRKLEWCKSYSYCTGWPCCPICGGIKPGHGRDENGTLPDNQGHRAGCDLAAAIDAQR